MNLPLDFGGPLVDPRQTGPSGGSIRPCDPTVTAQEAPRLSAQSAQILAMLKNRPVSNVELAQIALKYTSRISDLRAAGYHVENFDRDGKTGVTWYRLKP